MLTRLLESAEKLLQDDKPQGYLATWREYFARQIWCMSCTVALILRVWVSIRSKANHEDFIQLRQCLEYTWKNGGSFCMSSMCCLSLVFHVLFVAPFARAQNLKKLQDEKHLPAGRVGIFQFNSWCFFVLPRVIQDGKLFYDHGEGMYLHEGWHEGIWFLLPSHEKEGQTMIPMAKLVWSKVPTCPHNRTIVPYICIYIYTILYRHLHMDSFWRKPTILPICRLF